MSGRQRPVTKAELVRIRLEFRLAREGVALLEKKRDRLMAMGMQRLRQSRELRIQLAQKWGRLEAMWRDALAAESRDRLERLAAQVPTAGQVREERDSWMSVDLVELQLADEPPGPLGGIVDCDYRTERARGALYVLLPELMRLMSLETQVRRIAAVLKRCHRQVNALNNLILPELAREERRITDSLEERDREALFQVKRLKARA